MSIINDSSINCPKPIQKQEQLASNLVFECGFNTGKIAWAICDGLRLVAGQLDEQNFASKIETGKKMLRIMASAQKMFHYEC